MRTTASLLLMLLVAAGAAHMLYIYPLMPETVASHFDLAGKPDGWSSKASFITVYAVVLAIVAATVYGIALLLPKMPTNMINMPYRDYWLAPERRDESLAATRQSLLWIGVATLAFLIATMHLAYRANVGLQKGLGIEFWILLCMFSLAMLWTALWILKRFKNPATAP